MSHDQRLQFQPAPNSLHFYVQKVDRFGTVTLAASTSIDAARAAFRVLCEELPGVHLVMAHWSRVVEERRPDLAGGEMRISPWI